MKRIKLALIIAALAVATTACAQEQVVEPVASESIEVVFEKEITSDGLTQEPIIVKEIEYVPSPEYNPPVVTPSYEPEPETETEIQKPIATVVEFEDNNQVVIEVDYEGNWYIGNVYEQLFQQNVAEGTKIPVYTLQGTFIPIEGYEGQTWYEFQGDAVWTLDENYLGFIPNANEEYTLFISDNWTPDKEGDDFFICVQDY